jgi:two-component system NtrC family sensor kinase
MENADKLKDSTQSEQPIENLELFKERFVQTNKLAEIGQLTAGILHEIQNPLNFINNFSKLSIDLIGEMKGILEKQKEADLTEDEETLVFLLGKLEGVNLKIGENGGRVERIIRSMLAQTRNEDRAPQIVASDLNQLVEEFTKLAYQGVRGEDRTFNVAFVFNLDPAVGLVRLASAEIARVVLNLVNNACYAVNEKLKQGIEAYKPQIKVSTTRSKDTLEIKIWDNGIGIPDEIKEKIFSLFFTTKPVGKGTGLGLALSHDIVKIMHRGELSVASEIGTFTEFTIRLPLDL